jgi:streptogramin lyase
MMAVVVLLLIVASVGGFYAYNQLAGRSASCANPLGGAKTLKTQLATPTTISGVAEFALPSPDREPTAPTVAPDGSVWFGEQSVEGFAHFYPSNGTLVEYAWPYGYKAPPSSGGICGDKTSTWGVVLWDGKVWGSDTSGNQLVSLDPSAGQFAAVRLPTNFSFPYTLTPGPGNTLWFTELYGAKLGVLGSNGTLREYPLPGGINAEPSQIIFANSTTGYYSDVGVSEPKGGGVYSFNIGNFAPELLGGQHLTDPSSLTIGSGALWAALHGTSSVAGYNFTTKDWSYYPTTPVSWNPITLPYFVNAAGSYVWFNEHYGNRIARIDPASGSLAEYNEANGVVNGSIIGNALTFAVGGGRAWFTELTGNILGYVDASYTPGFSTSISGNSTVVMDRGSSASVNLVVHDTTHQGELNITFADSESFTSTPRNLTFSAASTSFAPPNGGESSIRVTVAASQSLKPGTYTAILTASDGLTYESSFLRIVVPG